MNADPNPDEIASARTTPVPRLARATGPGTNPRQKKSRRRRMLYQASQGAAELEAIAHLAPDPEQVRQIAANLRITADRLAAAKPARKAPTKGRRKSRRRPTRAEDAAAIERLKAAMVGFWDEHGEPQP